MSDKPPTKVRRYFEEEVTFLFHITDGCNLNCNHCFIDATPAPVNQFSLSEVTSILEDMRNLKTSRIVFSGGEPTLHKDFVHILETAHTIGFAPDFVSNGTTMTDKLAEEVKDHVRCVLISIDGPEEYHDAFRGKKGAFKRTMEGISSLKRNDVPFALQFTVTKKSFPFIEWIAETASQLGATSLKLEPLFTGGRAQDIASACLSEKEVHHLAELTTQLYGKYLATTSIYMGIHSKKVLIEHPCNAYACFGETCHRHAKNDPRQITILPDGNMAPVETCLHPCYYMGNVREKPLLQVVQDYFGSPQQIRFLDLCKRVLKERVIPYPYEAIPWTQILAEESWREHHE
ncbi:MAG: radical SAM protein [Theionarchaea archaeon]|nr:radical SAM protein [Theionarchaea archaeon]